LRRFLQKGCFICLKKAKLILVMIGGHESRLRAETHAQMNFFSKGGHSGVQARITEYGNGADPEAI
jgi:hypothetical protein